MHHLDSWIKRDQLDVTCFIISLFNAQHVSDVNTSETCWALNNEIIKQVTSSWSLFIQLPYETCLNCLRHRYFLLSLTCHKTCMVCRGKLCVICSSEPGAWFHFTSGKEIRVSPGTKLSGFKWHSGCTVSAKDQTQLYSPQPVTLLKIKNCKQKMG